MGPLGSRQRGPDKAFTGQNVPVPGPNPLGRLHAPMSDYRVLAAWPDFLRIAVEDILAPVALTAEYEETARRIREIAREHVAGFPGVGASAAGR
jgi:hypothetical protein